MKNIGNRIAVLYRKEQAYISHTMKEYHLHPSAYKFLVLLNHNEGCSQRDLSHILSIDEALATRAMKNLIDLQYVIRKKEKDNRSYNLYLTSKGKQIAPVLEEKLQTYWDEVLSVLNTEDRETFCQIIMTISGNV